MPPFIVTNCRRREINGNPLCTRKYPALCKNRGLIIVRPMAARLDQIRLISSWIFLFGNTYWLILWCVVLRHTRLRFLWILVATGTLGVILAVIGLIFIVHLRRMEDSFGFD